MNDIETILRSIIYIRDPEVATYITKEDCIRNFTIMQELVPKEPEIKAVKAIYYKIKDFIMSCEGKPEPPSIEYLYGYFKLVEGSESVITLLNIIKNKIPYVGMDLRTIIKDYNDKCNSDEFSKLLNEGNTIAGPNGMHIGTGRNKIHLKGIEDAIDHINRGAHELINSNVIVRTEGQIISEKMIREAREDYRKTQRNPTDSIGIKTWLTAIDNCTGGLKSGELMIALAFTGHCKTTFAVNKAYRAIYGGWNSAFVTLEMSYKEIRDKLFVLHSCSPKFREVKKYSHLVGKLSYKDVSEAKLTDEGKSYYDFVCDDLEQNPGYGKMYVWQPTKSGTTLTDIEFKMRQYQQELSTTNRNLEFCIIDYISMLRADDHQKTKDPNETVNNIVRDLKKFCLTFNKGAGIRVLSPHQSNRDGYKAAKANEGKYDLTAISNCHEIERSADLVISIFKNEVTELQDILKICCLKNRRNPFFIPFDARITLNNGYIFDSKVDYTKIVDISDVID